MLEISVYISSASTEWTWFKYKLKIRGCRKGVKGLGKGVAKGQYKLLPKIS